MRGGAAAGAAAGPGARVRGHGHGGGWRGHRSARGHRPHPSLPSPPRPAQRQQAHSYRRTERNPPSPTQRTRAPCGKGSAPAPIPLNLPHGVSCARAPPGPRGTHTSSRWHWRQGKDGGRTRLREGGWVSEASESPGPRGPRRKDGTPRHLRLPLGPRTRSRPAPHPPGAFPQQNRAFRGPVLPGQGPWASGSPGWGARGQDGPRSPKSMRSL